MKKFLVLYVIFGSLFFNTHLLFADDSKDKDSLHREIDQLRQEVQELKKLVKTQATNGVAGQATPTNQINAWSGNSKMQLTGYADVGFTAEESKNSSFSTGTFSPIFHYLYKDIALFESEVEFEVGEDGQTETNLEYSSIDLFLNDYATLVAGKFLSPIGQFRQNLHPSWINKLPSAPLGFGHDQAAPTDEVGLQLRGGVPVDEAHFNYAVFVGNGPKLESNVPEEALLTSLLTRHAEDGAEDFILETSSTDGNDNKVIGGRLGFLPISDLEVGISGATGKASSDEGNRNYDVYGGDLAFQYDQLDFKSEYVNTSVDSLEGSSDIELEAWYLQLAYKLPFYDKLEPVARWGRYNSTDSVLKQWSLGLNYLFSNNIIGKLAYDINDNNEAEDGNRFMAQLAYGF